LLALRETSVSNTVVPFNVKRETLFDGLPIITTPGYAVNLSTIWIFSDSSNERDLHSELNIKMNIYIGYAIIIAVSVVSIVVTIVCGKKILKQCRRKRHSRHQILQEDEDEETSFSLSDIHTDVHGSSERISRGMKQE
jgi:heme exporter protein D